ncbi:MAG: beta-keto acid cleavage family enzyme [Chloroflexota bacterium]
MDKLIVTVATDSKGSYPGNPYCPASNDVDAVVAENVRAVNAGAAITHIHGVRYLEREIQADGRRVSKLDFNGWKEMQEKIVAACHPIMSFGIASARIDERIRLMDLKPDMMAIIFTAHDEYFRNDTNFPPTEVLALHPRSELEAYCVAANEKGVKPDIECFYTGAFFNIEHIAKKGLLREPIFTSLFFWPGGNWTPQTFKALMFMTENLPKGLKINWNCCGMDRSNYWQILTMAIMMGGHVRVGWEDCPYLDDKGTLAETNALLVEKIVRIARELGREIASPAEAREILGLRQQ